MKWSLVAFALLGCAAVGSEAQVQPKTFHVWLEADVGISPEGAVNAITWRDERPALKQVIAKIEPLVNSWEFVPGTVDGLPAPTRTYLSVEVIGEARDDGMLDLKFGRVRAGASARGVAPHYPPAAARAGVSAEIVAEVAVDAAGKKVIQSIAFEGSRKDSFRKQFIAAATEAIGAWAINPERVAGRPVPARMSIPITFCVDTSDWCTRRERSAQGTHGAESDPVSMPTPRDSVVLLVSQVEGQKI